MEDLHIFAKLNEGRLYSLLKTCLSTQTDLKSLIKSGVSLVRSTRFLALINLCSVRVSAAS